MHARTQTIPCFLGSCSTFSACCRSRAVHRPTRSRARCCSTPELLYYTYAILYYIVLYYVVILYYVMLCYVSARMLGLPARYLNDAESTMDGDLPPTVHIAHLKAVVYNAFPFLRDFSFTRDFLPCSTK